MAAFRTPAMARPRIIVTILVTSLMLSVLPVPLASIVGPAVPARVAAGDDDLAQFPPAGWTVTQSSANDGDDATSVDLNQGFCHPNCGVTLTFTPSAGTFPAIGSFRVLWSQTSSFGSAIDFVQLTCAGTVLWHDGSGFGGSGTQTYDTGRQAVTGTMSPQTSSFSCTWLMHSTFSAGALRVYSMSVWEAAAPPPPGDAGGCCPYTFGKPDAAAFSPDPVNLATGSFTSNADDLVLPGRVLGFAFTRWYNSADDRAGPLGPGWTHSFNWSLTDNGATVELRRGDGRRDAFTRNPDETYANPPNVFDSLVKNADGTYTLTLTSQVAYEFSTTGQLVRVHEPSGNQVTLAYTGVNPTTITNTAGRQITLTYDGSNRLTQLQDPLGRKVTYAYDASGRLTTVTDKIGNAPGQDPSLHRWSYAYDGTSRHITTITDPDGRVRVTNTYDAQGRVYQQRDGLNALTQMTYSAGQTVLTDPRGHQTTYTFDARMRVLSQTDVVGSNTYTISYVYDTAGNRTSVTDRKGKTTDLTYDARGNLLTKTEPQVDPQTPRYLTQFQYDLKNNVTQITDPLGFVTTMSYDPTTNVLTRVSRQIGASTFAVTTYEYGDPANSGLPTKMIAPRGNTGPTPNYAYATTLSYDAQGDLVTSIDPDGAKTTFTYDVAGRLVSFVDPDGYATGANPADHTWQVAHDENDRETRRTDPLGHALAYGYDGAGNRTTVTDRDGNVTTYTYDANSRLATTQQKPDPAGQPTLVYTTSMTRDPNGNTTRITQPNNVVTDYAFDALNRLSAVTTHPDAQTNLTTSYVLDGNGNPQTRTSADGVIVTYAYDALSRLTSVTAPSLTTISYAYDAASRRTQMTDGTGTTSYQYDGLGRATQVAAPNGTLTYAYDLDGNRTTLGYPGSQNVSYSYTPGGRLDTVLDWSGRTSMYTYQPSGLVSSLAYPNGMRATYTYDRAQRLTQLTNALNSTTITQDTYTLDAEGNRTALDEYVQGITAPPVSWDSAVRVNTDAGSTEQKYPAMATGADGTAYLVWGDGRLAGVGVADVYFSSRSTGAGAWSVNERVSDVTNGTQDPAIAVDGTGKVFAIWTDFRNGNFDIYASTRSPATGTWSANKKVNDDTKGNKSQTRPRVAVDGSGNALAVWYDQRSNQNNIYASRLPAGASTWNASLRVTDDTAAVKTDPDTAFAPNGTATAVWSDTRSGSGIYNVYSSTLAAGSNSWATNTRVNDVPTSLSFCPSCKARPRLGIDGAGNILVVWVDSRRSPAQLRFTRRLAGAQAWPASAAVPDTQIAPTCGSTGNEPCGIALTVRVDGSAYLVWEDARDGRMWGSQFDPSAGSWSARQQVSDGAVNTGGNTTFPPDVRIAVAFGSSQITAGWEDGRNGNPDIYSRRATLSTGMDHFTYTYDGLNRLKAATGPVAEGFTFDGASNIVSRTGPPATNAYDASNRLTSDGTKTFVWDGADRMISRGADTFSYDALSRLTMASVGGSTRNFAYNGDGQLVVAGVVTQLWDSKSKLSRLLQSGTDRIVYGLGPLYAVRADASTYTFARDGLGSVRGEVTDSGALTKSFRYAAYGVIAASNGGGPSLLGFAGEFQDGGGLVYLRARWYDPSTGRLLTRDPFLGSAGVPTSLNGFVYAADRPTLFTDPLGLDPSSATTSSPDSSSLLGSADADRLIAFLRDVGAFVGSDYVRISGGVRGISIFGPGSSVAIDRYGNVYWQPLGLSAGTPGGNVSVMVGWLLQITKPSERDLRSFLEGPSYAGGTALGAGVNVVTSPLATGTKVAVESGVGTPFAGVSGGMSFFVGKLPLQW